MVSNRLFVIFITIFSVLTAVTVVTVRAVHSQMMGGGHRMGRGHMMNQEQMQMMQDMMSGKLPPGIAPEDLPDPGSEGARLLAGYCAQCHNLPSPAMHTSEEWPAVAQRMFDRMSLASGPGRGMMGMMRVSSPTAEEEAVIVGYLQAHSLKPIGPSGIPAPDSPGAAVFKNACSQCHALPDPKLHTAQEWPAVVSRMQMNMQTMGKKVITDDEKTEIVGYLSENARR